MNLLFRTLFILSCCLSSLSISAQEPLTFVDQKPIWPGCDTLATQSECESCSTRKLYNALTTLMMFEMECPELEERLYCRITFDSTGKVVSSKILNGALSCIPQTFEEKLLRLPKHTAPRHEGKNVGYQMNFPFEYTDIRKLDLIEWSDKEWQRIIDENDTTQIWNAAIWPSCLLCEQKYWKACREDGMLRFVYANVDYPDEAKKHFMQGTVMVYFEVSEEGKVEEVRIMESPHDVLSQASLDVVKNCPDHYLVPGIVNQRYRVAIPVRFSFN